MCTCTCRTTTRGRRDVILVICILSVSVIELLLIANFSLAAELPIIAATQDVTFALLARFSSCSRSLLDHPCSGPGRSSPHRLPFDADKLPARVCSASPEDDPPPGVCTLSATPPERVRCKSLFQILLTDRPIQCQDYPQELISEVVIVDDSPANLSLAELSPGLQDVDGLRVDYVRITDQRSIGEKRNIAVNHSTGTLLAFWDDDDIYGSQRLREQLAPLAAGKASMTVLPHALTYFMGDDSLFATHRGAASCNVADLGGCSLTARSSWGPHFGTLAYLRSLHSASVSYPDTSEAEDYMFAQVPYAVNRGVHKVHDGDVQSGMVSGVDSGGGTGVETGANRATHNTTRRRLRLFHSYGP